MSDKPLVLSFDVGTQSMRAILFNSIGEIENYEQIKYETPYFVKENTYIEQDPNFYFEMLCEASRRLKAKNPSDFDRIIAVTSTCFRDSVLCLDENFKPITNTILWLDKREVDRNLLPKIPLFKRILFKIVGKWETIETQQRQSACNWLMVNDKETWDKCKKFVFLPTYINYLLSGNLIDSSAGMIGHMPFDFKKGRWMKKNGLTRCLYDIPSEKLSNISKCGEIIGHIVKETANLTGIKEGTPLISTGADKASETLGLSVSNREKAAISFGTASTITFYSDKYKEPMAFAPCYPGLIDDSYNPEFQVYRGYWMLSWFKEQFCKEEMEEAKKLGVRCESILDKTLKTINPGSDGLILEPYWTPGILCPNMRGSIIGFTDKHTKYHIYRAIIEGIGFSLMDAMYTMERRTGNKIKTLYVGGGGSQSDEICQITADMFGLPVKRVQTHESCGLGGAIVAFKRMQVHTSYDEAIKNMVRDKETFTPNLKNHEIYMDLYTNVYRHLEKKLLPMNIRIKKILKDHSA